MLLTDLFSIGNLQDGAGVVSADIHINETHRIFEGHFPGQPVVPGVCMMQLIKDIIEQVSGKKTNLVQAHEMKFLAIIDPRQNTHIKAELKYATENNGMNVMATLSGAELVHFKFKGRFDFL